MVLAPTKIDLALADEENNLFWIRIFLFEKFCRVTSLGFLMDEKCEITNVPYGT